MCSVSMVMDHYRQQYPDYNRAPVMSQQFPAQWPFGINPSPRVITEAEYAEFLRLKAMASELDKKLGQPDCEDPTKEAWQKEVERRLGILEQRT